MGKKAIPSFRPGETVYFDHPYAHQGEFVCFVPAGQAVSELIPEDIPPSCRYYKVDASKRNRVLVKRTRPVSVNGVLLCEIVEYYALMPGSIRKEE